ncbi:hypothetical protein M8C21_010028 [Ambrosia artemisiifolia]|uniref:Legumain prodomain domain-containing protein n=1 Tax=Ambrosia artemisiifolia TaxID=4212 RepID=A0AAD5CKZ1_AMBAR|nr:hypothetical protein M8C21_010028 [Ambrosia artemisiifolia]
MMSRHVMWLLLMLVMLSNTCLSEPLNNGTRWELLESIADQIHVQDGISVPTPEYYRYYLWDLYKSSPRSQRLETINKMSEAFKQLAYRDWRLDVLGLFLFGPDKGRSFLRIRHDERPEPVDVLGYVQCSQVLDDLFEKHCGPPCLMGLRHRHSRENLCYLATKEAIEEAMILACGMNVIEPGAVPQQQVPYGYLASVTGLLFMTPFASKDILDQDANDNGIARLLNWAKRVLVVTAIYLSYVGSPSAIVAVACCLALDYVTGSIIAPMLFKKTELPLEKFTDGWTRDQVSEWVSSPGFKEWVIKNYHKVIILSDASQDE